MTLSIFTFSGGHIFNGITFEFVGTATYIKGTVKWNATVQFDGLQWKIVRKANGQIPNVEFGSAAVDAAVRDTQRWIESREWCR